MAIWVRVVAITIEISLLTAITFSMLGGVYLAAFDLGLKTKYSRMVALALITMGALAFIFYIAHHTTFYPGLEVPVP